MELPETIAEMMQEWLSHENWRLCSGGTFTVKDMLNVMAVATGKLDNFIIFQNGGGKPFDIFNVEPANFIEFLEHIKGYTYAYKHNGVEVILTPLQQW